MGSTIRVPGYAQDQGLRLPFAHERSYGGKACIALRNYAFAGCGAACDAVAHGYACAFLPKIYAHELLKLLRCNGRRVPWLLKEGGDGVACGRWIVVFHGLAVCFPDAVRRCGSVCTLGSTRLKSQRPGLYA